MVKVSNIFLENTTALDHNNNIIHFTVLCEQIYWNCKNGIHLQSRSTSRQLSYFFLCLKLQHTEICIIYTAESLEEKKFVNEGEKKINPAIFF